MKALRLFLLALILIGIGLLATTHYWVPNVVGTILKGETYPVATSVVSTTTKAVITPSPSHTTPKPVPTVESGIDITATIGPTCPVQHMPEVPECADKPYQTTLVLASTIIGRNGGVLIKTDAAGHYSQDLGPGTYTIRAQSNDTPPTLNPVTFEVKDNARTTLNLEFDSGIR